jgi:hypothetical protein
LRDRKKLFNIFAEIDDLYVKVLKEGPFTSKYKILDECTNLCFLLFKTYLFCWTIAGIIVMLYPGLMYYYYHELYFSFSSFIPFLANPFMTKGFIITTIYHFFCFLLVFFGTVAMDNLFIIVVAHYAVKIELFNVMVKELNEYLRITENTEHNAEWSAKVEELLNDIIEQHQLIITEVSRLSEVFYYPIAFQIGSVILSLASGVFLSVTVRRLKYLLTQ